MLYSDKKNSLVNFDNDAKVVRRSHNFGEMGRWVGIGFTNAFTTTTLSHPLPPFHHLLPFFIYLAIILFFPTFTFSSSSFSSLFFSLSLLSFSPSTPNLFQHCCLTNHCDSDIGHLYTTPSPWNTFGNHLSELCPILVGPSVYIYHPKVAASCDQSLPPTILPPISDSIIIVLLFI